MMAGEEEEIEAEEAVSRTGAMFHLDVTCEGQQGRGLHINLLQFNLLHRTPVSFASFPWQENRCRLEEGPSAVTGAGEEGKLKGQERT
ncbi:hypothetical protein E2C01_059315 [Portunus trituberculatus]|uniref:Uncharacterized protein n=1 Tax=Portunus trituberculatus TaxID=210409 RepID=A0A5B7H8R6_PORTR|nr:hypothetical protein [Portunus trituberculatus]